MSENQEKTENLEPEKETGKEKRKKKKALKRTRMPWLYRLLLILATPLVKIIYPVKVLKRENYPKGEKMILASNHLKWVDVFLIAVYFPQFHHLIGKKEIGRNPFIKWGAGVMQVVLVDRGNTDLASMRKTIGYLKKGDSIVLFPEGTRNKSDESFKEAKGGVVMFSLKGDAQIVPAMIYKRAKAFKRNYIYVDTPFKLDELAGKPLNASVMEQGAKTVEEKMRAAKETMDAYIENKQWKADKKLKKQERKRLKKERTN